MIHLTRSAIRRWLERLLHTHDTPERTALAFAVGVFIGFSPLLGLHTALGLAVAFGFGLNRLAVLLGAYANLPWFLGPYYTVATILGAGLLGTSHGSGVLAELGRALGHWSLDEVHRLSELLRPLLWSFVLGSFLLAAAVAGTAYPVALTFVRASRRRRSGPATNWQPVVSQAFTHIADPLVHTSEVDSGGGGAV